MSKSKVTSKLRISIGHHATDPILKNIGSTLEEIHASVSDILRKQKTYPEEPYKQENHIVRGHASLAKKYETSGGVKHKNITPRKDDYINSADILVADIDETDIAVEAAHKRLVAFKIPHVIYTSFNHSLKKPKYRIIIPCSISCKANCKPTTQKLEKQLGIEFDPCSYKWSQRWYYGTMHKPKLYQAFISTKGKEYQEAEPTEEELKSKSKKQRAKSRKNNRKTIGKSNHFYEQTKSLAQGYANNNKTAILGDSTDNEEVFNMILNLLRADASSNGEDLDSYKFIKNIHVHIWGAIKKVIIESNNKKSKTTTASNIFELFEDMTVTDKMVSKIESIKPLYKDVIAKGHIVGFIGLPNSGKTSLMRFFCESLAKKYSLVYINMDVGPDEIKFQQEHASKFQYKLIAPNFTNMSNKKVLEKIESISNCGMDLSNTVMIIDSTKKLVKVNQKDTASDFLEVLRAANSKGVTIILLMHTTKYRDAEGNLIHAGTQDFIDDIDETNFIEYVLRGDTQHIAIYPDKLRNTFVKKTSYTYNRKQRVITKDKTFNDLKKVNIAGKKVRQNDNKHILSIIDVIQNGTVIKGKIVSMVSQLNPEHSQKHTKELLHALSNENYTGYCLIEEEGCENNSTHYTLKEDFDLKVYKKLLALKIK